MHISLKNHLYGHINQYSFIWNSITDQLWKLRRVTLSTEIVTFLIYTMEISFSLIILQVFFKDKTNSNDLVSHTQSIFHY